MWATAIPGSALAMMLVSGSIATTTTTTTPSTTLPTVVALDDWESPSWRPVEDAPIPFPDPHYHPAIIKPPPPPPKYSPMPMKNMKGRMVHYHKRYIKWAVRDTVAACTCEYNGYVVPCYCKDVRFKPWYLVLNFGKSKIYGNYDDVWKPLDDDMAKPRDLSNIPDQVREYKEKALRDPAATCTATYNGWDVPSRCPDRGPGDYYNKTRWSRFNIHPPTIELPPSDSHYWNDPNADLPNPFASNATEAALFDPPGDPSTNMTCWPYHGSLGKRQNVPDQAVRRNIFDICDRLINTVSSLHGLISTPPSSTETSNGTHIWFKQHNTLEQLMKNDR